MRGRSRICGGARTCRDVAGARPARTCASSSAGACRGSSPSSRAGGGRARRHGRRRARMNLFAAVVPALRAGRRPAGRARPVLSPRQPRPALGGLAQRARRRLSGPPRAAARRRRAYAIGVALNAVLPGRGGDAAKVRSPVPRAGFDRADHRGDDVGHRALRHGRGHAARPRRRPHGSSRRSHRSLPSPSANAVIAAVVAVGVAVARGAGGAARRRRACAPSASMSRRAGRS